MCMLVRFESCDTMLIQRLTQSIRIAPGVILRLLRVILLRMVLRGAGIVLKILHLRPNSGPIPPTASPCMACEPSRRGASCSMVATALSPMSSTGLLPLGAHDDPLNNLSPPVPSALDTSLSSRQTASVTPPKVVPTAPEEIQRYLRRTPMYV